MEVPDAYQTKDSWHAAYLYLMSEYPYTLEERPGKNGSEYWFSFPGYEYHRELLEPFRRARKHVMHDIF
jgi:hypothetical protein